MGKAWRSGSDACSSRVAGARRASGHLCGPGRRGAGRATIIFVDVYNIEVHNEHVFRVTEDGVLVHNACNRARDAAIGRYGEAAMKGWQAAHIIPRNGRAWADEALGKIIDRVTSLKLIDDIDVNIFYSNAGHMGTHTQKYVDDLISVMKNRVTTRDMANGINLLWNRIKAGDYIQ